MFTDTHTDRQTTDRLVYYKLTFEPSAQVDQQIVRRNAGGSVVEHRTPEREVGGSKPTSAVLCP